MRCQKRSALFKIGKDDLIKGSTFKKKLLNHLFDKISAADPFYLFFQGPETIDSAYFFMAEKGGDKIIFLKDFIYH